MLHSSLRSRASLHSRRTALAAVGAAGALLAAGVAAAPAHADDRVVVVQVPHGGLAASGARLRALDDDTRVEAEVVLDLQDEQGAEDLATAVSTPGSAQYRQFVAPADWIARYAPTQQAADDVVAAAQAGGLTVDPVPASRLFVLVRGTVDQLQQVFDTALASAAVDGEHLVVPTRDVSLPADAARHVRTVVFDRPAVRSAAVPAKASTKEAPCSSWWGQHAVRIPKAYGRRSAPTALCGYTAKQLRAASGLRGSALDGRGTSIAVVDAFGSSTIGKDLATYSSRNHLPAAAYTQSVPARSTWDADAGCDTTGWGEEQTLDLEAAHAIAPRASLVYVGAADCVFGVDAAVSQVLDQHLASVLSLSWGSPVLDRYAAQLGLADEVTMNVHQQLQAAAEGIGVVVASGDFGDDSLLLDERAVDFPASSPWVTAVGGTTTALDRHDRVVFRTAWGDRAAVARRGAARWSQKPAGEFFEGAGGGTSSRFTAPAYQAGVVPTGLGRGARAVSDVSALAAPETGLSVGITQHGRYRSVAVGGTSLAAPIVAAQVALAEQRSGRAFGFLNPALYASRGALEDVRPSAQPRFVAETLGRTLALITFDRDGSLKAQRGYDLPTGLGVLTPGALAALGR